MEPASTPAPVPKQERIVDLDILRGIALFGILVVNLKLFANPLFSFVVEIDSWQQWYHQAADFLIRFLFEGKFITLFSLLFGLGFYIFTERLKARGEKARRVFLRRMGILFVIGLLHAWAFWSGDILAPYAIGGLILMLFLNRKNKTIKIWMGLFIGGMLLFMVFIWLMILWGQSVPEAAVEIEQSFTEMEAEYQQLMEEGYEVYLHGSWSEMVEYRRQETGFAWLGMFMSPLGILYFTAIFLGGLLIGRKGLLTNPRLLRELLIPKRYLFTLSGLGLSAVYAVSFYFADPLMFNLWHIIQVVSIVFGAPLLCLGYSGFILNWLENSKRPGILHAFAPAGRMALTNYLMQTLICTTLFYGYGLGWYGQLPPLAIIPLAVVIFGIQIAYSKWYFRTYRMGPMEKLWRLGTYLKRV